MGIHDRDWFHEGRSDRDKLPGTTSILMKNPGTAEPRKFYIFVVKWNFISPLRLEKIFFAPSRQAKRLSDTALFSHFGNYSVSDFKNKSLF